MYGVLCVISCNYPNDLYDVVTLVTLYFLFSVWRLDLLFIQTFCKRCRSWDCPVILGWSCDVYGVYNYFLFKHFLLYLLALVIFTRPSTFRNDELVCCRVIALYIVCKLKAMILSARRSTLSECTDIGFWGNLSICKLKYWNRRLYYKVVYKWKMLQH